jgi:hypothetical protein
VGQKTFETRSLYLILAEKLFTLPTANEILPLSALFQASTEKAASVYKSSPPGRKTGYPEIWDTEGERRRPPRVTVRDADYSSKCQLPSWRLYVQVTTCAFTGTYPDLTDFRIAGYSDD